MFRQSKGSQFTLVWEFKQITILLKTCSSLPICSHREYSPLTVFNADASSCASSPSDTVKAPGSLKLCSTILINKQVSKRGQITVKPSKDGCCWNKPWWLENQRALLLPESLPNKMSVSELTQVHPAWCLSSCGEPPRSYSSYCCCSNCARNLGGRKCHHKYFWIFAVKNGIDPLMRFFFSVLHHCWTPIPDTAELHTGCGD